MSNEKKDQVADKDMEQVSGGVSVGTFQVRGGGTAGLAKIGDDEGTVSEFVPTTIKTR